MQVEVFQAHLTIREKTVKVTKTVARQFPVRSLQVRAGAIDRGDSIKEPLGKVLGATLGSPATWLYLVKDNEAGLAWEPAASLADWLVKSLIDQGAPDTRPLEVNPENVPTIIL